MIQATPQAEVFQQQFGKSLQQETLNTRAVKFPKHAHIYTCGDEDETVYFIERGQVKLLMLAPDGIRVFIGDSFSRRCFRRVMFVRFARAARNRHRHGRDGTQTNSLF